MRHSIHIHDGDGHHEHIHVTWEENKHPRDPDGKFASGGGEGSPLAESPQHHEQAIKHYTGSGFKQVNGHLIAGIVADYKTKNTIAALDDLTQRAFLPASATVYRGAGSLAVKNILEQAGGQLRKGQVLTMKGFTSTSLDRTIAEGFANQARTSILIEMRLPKGAKALDISQHSDVGPHEKETLIARNSAFKVLSYQDKTRTLVLEMLMSPSSADKAPTVDSTAPKTSLDDANRFCWEGDKNGIAVSGPADGDVVLTAEDLEI